MIRITRNVKTEVPDSDKLGGLSPITRLSSEVHHEHGFHDVCMIFEKAR